MQFERFFDVRFKLWEHLLQFALILIAIVLTGIHMNAGVIYARAEFMTIAMVSTFSPFLAPFKAHHSYYSTGCQVLYTARLPAHNPAHGAVPTLGEPACQHDHQPSRSGLLAGCGCAQNLQRPTGLPGHWVWLECRSHHFGVHPNVSLGRSKRCERIRTDWI